MVRDAGGRVVRGSLNPGGRPVGFRTYLQKLIGEHGEKAFDIAWQIADGKRRTDIWLGTKTGPIQLETGPTIREQLDAAFGLIEHLNGKPAVTVQGSKDADPVRLEVTHEPPGPEYLAEVVRILEGAGVPSLEAQDEQILVALSNSATDGVSKP